MRRSTDFASVVRSGSRARRGQLVVHYLPELRSGPAIVGLVVGKTIGPSVARHQVSRRLRGLLADRLDVFQPGSGTVVRAMPGTADAPSALLGRDLDAALVRLLGAR